MIAWFIIALVCLVFIVIPLIALWRVGGLPFQYNARAWSGEEAREAIRRSRRAELDAWQDHFDEISGIKAQREAEEARRRDEEAKRNLKERLDRQRITIRIADEQERQFTTYANLQTRREVIGNPTIYGDHSYVFTNPTTGAKLASLNVCVDCPWYGPDHVCPECGATLTKVVNVPKETWDLVRKNQLSRGILASSFSYPEGEDPDQGWKKIDREKRREVLKAAGVYAFPYNHKQYPNRVHDFSLTTLVTGPSTTRKGIDVD